MDYADNTFFSKCPKIKLKAYTWVVDLIDTHTMKGKVRGHDLEHREYR